MYIIEIKYWGTVSWVLRIIWVWTTVREQADLEYPFTFLHHLLPIINLS